MRLGEKNMLERERIGMLLAARTDRTKHVGHMTVVGCSQSLTLKVLRRYLLLLEHQHLLEEWLVSRVF